MKLPYQKEELSELCKNSYSYNEILTKTGRTKSTPNREVLKKYIKLYNIDISHFTSSTSPNKRVLKIGDKKICQQCKMEKDAFEDYYWSNGHTRSICKECVRKNEKEKYNQRQEDFINFKKTLCCKKCGEKRYYLLDFHHRNPKEKDFSISDKTRIKIENMKQEFDKCDILCSNCHREWHYLNSHNIIKNYDNWLNNKE